MEDIPQTSFVSVNHSIGNMSEVDSHRQGHVRSTLEPTFTALWGILAVKYLPNVSAFTMLCIQCAKMKMHTAIWHSNSKATDYACHLQLINI